VLLQAGERLEPARLERSLLWLQTSSPSALLLASCAASLQFLHGDRGRRQLGRALALAGRLRQRLDEAGLPLVPNQDPLRLVLHSAALGISGLAADDWLLPRGVIAELPEPGCLTFCLGMVPPAGLLRRLPRQLLALGRSLGGPPLPAFEAPPLPLVAEPELALALAWRAPAEALPLEDLEGRIAAEALCPYPPGIPLLIPGERIDRARLAWLLAQRRLWPGQIPDTVRVVAP